MVEGGGGNDSGARRVVTHEGEGQVVEGYAIEENPLGIGILVWKS